MRVVPSALPTGFQLYSGGVAVDVKEVDGELVYFIEGATLLLVGSQLDFSKWPAASTKRAAVPSQAWRLAAAWRVSESR